jgi:hypothetical protein
MAMGKILLMAAVFAVVGAGLGERGWAQNGPPSAEVIAERLKAQGITVTPEQIEQGRKMMQDMQNGVQPDPEQMQKMMADFRKQAQDQLKVRLGSTDEEWAVLEPKITAVQNLVMQKGAGGMGGMMGRFSFGAATQPATDMQKARQALQDVVKNADATKGQIQGALDGYRAAVGKLNAELVKAQNELRQILIVRQEAILSQMGLLE